MKVASSTIRLRLLGAALGALVSAAAALVTSFTIILGIIGAIGIPVGAVIGFVIAPRLVVAVRPIRLVVFAGLAAVPLGTLTYGFLMALSEGRGASALDLLGAGIVFSITFGLYGLLFGLPMAVVVAAIAAGLLRRLASRTDRLWIPSSLVLGLVVGLVGVAVALTLQTPGQRAAQFADSVGFEYWVDNLSDREFSLDVRTYWQGEAIGGSSQSYVASGRCVTSGSGNNALQASDWAIWLGEPDQVEWLDRPPGPPLITNVEYGRPGTVRLTIVIDESGTARAIPGLVPGPC